MQFHTPGMQACLALGARERVTPTEVPAAANELLPEIGNKLKHVERKGGCPPTSDLSERVTPSEVPLVCSVGVLFLMG